MSMFLKVTCGLKGYFFYLVLNDIAIVFLVFIIKLFLEPYF
jgi:hypothetical protein